MIIKDKDMFDLFFNKVPSIWKAIDPQLKKDQTYQPACLYKESVHVIQAIEQFVSDLKSGSLPRVPHLNLDWAGHAEPDFTFHPYFQRLKFERKMFDSTYLYLGVNWEFFQKFLAEDLIDSSFHVLPEQIEVIGSDSSDSQESRRQWKPSMFKHEKALRVINFFSELQQNDLYLKKIDEQNREIETNINDAFLKFDRILEIHSEVYVLVLDVRFVRIVNEEKNKPLGQLIEQVLKDRPAIQDIIFQSIPNLLHAHTKLEHDYRTGLNLSCVCILSRLRVGQEEDVVAHLQMLLRSSFSHYDVVDVLSRNKFVRQHATKYAVGSIGKVKPRQIEQFKYWVLSYFFKIDSFCKLIHPKRPFELNKEYWSPDWQQLKIKKQAALLEKKPPVRNLAQVLQELKISKGVWGVKHLTECVANRLLIGRIYYYELCVEQGLSNEYGEWLFRIEVFVETLLHNRYPAFDYGKVLKSHSWSAREIQTLATQLGQQYLSLVKQTIFDPLFWKNLNDLIQKSDLRTWWFEGEINLLLLNEFSLNHVRHILNHPIDLEALALLNRNCVRARECFLEEKTLRADRHKHLEKHYAQCVRRDANTREYLNKVLKHNCWVYRVIVSASSSAGKCTQAELSKLFTEFMRLAKRAKPCYWLRGYIGLWQEKDRAETSEFILDAVLFFDDRCQELVETVVSDLNQRWKSFLNTKAAHILKQEDIGNRKYSGTIKSRALMYSVEELNTKRIDQSTYYLCLESVDRKMKKMVIEYVVPYFSYRDVFQAPFSQEVAKTFIKGAMPKK